MQYIYGMADPRDKRVRYVGKSNDPDRRYPEHIERTEDTPKGRWIQELRSLQLKPIMIILDACDDDQVFYLENWWILLGRRQGWELTNSTRQGEWRVADDFKALFADELMVLYQEHKAACERLSEETISLAIQKAQSRLDSEAAEQAKRRYEWGVRIMTAILCGHMSISIFFTLMANQSDMWIVISLSLFVLIGGFGGITHLLEDVPFYTIEVPPVITWRSAWGSVRDWWKTLDESEKFMFWTVARVVIFYPLFPLMGN